ncbi:Protein CBG00410 [Caenorhabditis briggsae]|uniref:Serpentine receptor class gamma n=2 Tax=Caenorhabditis briggsae TaxID=6238 RepID=A0AAE9D3D6_CAEBR|nr:Protein CBG00410 [Caenorhabditis briggsae]ULT92968.1 hypothetical protein L3Y34_002861 [Caenorhabditis briggsae]CAP21865.1 Protein CBG00410 [Caenorhabditis briggsae]
MVFIAFNISNVVLSLLCIPLLISIKKRRASASYSNPERYIVWQAFNLVLFKLITIPLSFLIHAHNFQPFFVVLFLMSVDNIVTPVLMQLSYLSCNKRNMMAIVKTLFCCNKRPSAVQPQYQPHGSSEDS